MIKDEKILVRTTSLLSFAGKVIESKINFNNNESLVLQTSDQSLILIIIPYSEVKEIFYMNGEVEKYND